MKLIKEMFIVSSVCIIIGIFLTIMLFISPPEQNQTILAYAMIISFYIIGILFIWMSINELSKDKITERSAE